MSKRALRASHYREMADEIRSIADGMTAQEHVDAMYKIADDYERMAQSAQQLEDGAAAQNKGPCFELMARTGGFLTIARRCDR